MKLVKSGRGTAKNELLRHETACGMTVIPAARKGYNYC